MISEQLRIFSRESFKRIYYFFPLMNCEAKFQCSFCCFLRSMIFFFFLMNLKQVLAFQHIGPLWESSLHHGVCFTSQNSCSFPSQKRVHSFWHLHAVAGIKNERRTKAFRLYDGTNIHVVINQGGLPILK